MCKRDVIAAGEAGQINAVDIARIIRERAPLIDLSGAPVPSCKGVKDPLDRISEVRTRKGGECL